MIRIIRSFYWAMATSNLGLFARCSAKQIFTRCFVAAFKDKGVDQNEISKWITLTLCFEDPTKSLKPGVLFFERIPKYSEIYQSGVCIYGFGIYARHVAALRKYWKHEWFVTAILGRETIDNYSQSPLVKYHDYSHVDKDLIKKSLPNFIGEIQQNNFGPVFDKNYHVENYDPRQHSEPEPRIKYCYSIEMLSKNDREIKFHLITDGLFNCRTFIRDLSIDINCPSSIDSVQLNKLGPVTLADALLKHEIHYEQLIKCAENLTPICVGYQKELRQQYPTAKAGYRFI